MTKRRVTSLESLQLFVFLLRFDQHRQIRIGIFPESEEILIGLARFRCVTRQNCRARQAQLRQRTKQ